MGRPITRHPAVSYAGYGHQGFCAACSLIDPVIQKEIDSRVLNISPEKLNAWCSERGLPTFDRMTWYKHRKHVQNPKDRFVTAVVKHQIEHGVQPQTVTDEAFLQAVIAAGAARVAADPNEVSIDHALRAVQTRLSAKGQEKSQISILIGVLTDRPAAPQVAVVETIEADFTEVE